MSNSGKITVASAVFTLCKSMLGASMTNVPGLFTELGLGFGLIVFVVMAVVNVYSLLYLTIVARETQSEGLVQIGEKVDKKKGKIFVTLTLFLMCMVPLIFYIIKSTLYIGSFLKYFSIKIEPKYVRIVVSIICMVMSICFKKADKLKHVSIVGLVSLSFMTLYTIYLVITNFSNITFTGQKMFNLNSKSIEKISVVCFAFCSQFSILDITNNFESLKDCKNVIFSGHIISLLVYLVTGICGHFAQTTYDTDDFFKSIPKNAFTEILKLTLAIVNISTFPLIMLATRQAFDFFITGNKKVRNLGAIQNCEVIFLVAVCYLVSIPFDEHQNLLAATFFFTGSIVMFALPSYFYYRVMKDRLTLFTYVMLGVNTLLTLFGFFAGIFILIP